MSLNVSQDVVLHTLRKQLPAALPDYLIQRRWFGGKSRKIGKITVLDLISFQAGPVQACITIIRVEYASGPEETYSLPLALREEEDQLPDDVATLRLAASDKELAFYDALSSRSFQDFLLQTIQQNGALTGEIGDLRASATAALPQLIGPESNKLVPKLMRAEQSNTSIAYGNRLIFKWFRRVERGLNPDVEIGVFLTEKTGFRNVPQVAGFMEYAGRDGSQATMGLLQAYVANQGDAWQFTLKSLENYYGQPQQNIPALPQSSLLTLAEGNIPAEAREKIGQYLDSAALLGLRTAELHLALATGTDSAFAPEPFDRRGARELAESALGLMDKVLPQLHASSISLSAPEQAQASEVLAAEPRLRNFFADLENLKTTAQRTRIHGDYHLGQVLYTGEDFMIIDFEGEPARSLDERRRKRSPLQDVAGMLRSFDYAAYAPLMASTQDTAPENANRERQKRFSWGTYWKVWVSAAFLRGYLAKAGKAPFVPKERAILEKLLNAYLIDKALYELGYELNNRPSWLPIPLNGITGLLETGK